MSEIQITIDGQKGRFPSEGGVVRMGDDYRMNVVFYKRAVIDPIKSRQLGRPYSVPVDYVRIQQPGEKDCVDRPVRENDDAIRRWPSQWGAYQNQQVQAPPGTPVDVLFPQTPEIPANLHGLGIHTVEQLAGLTEHGAQTVGMGATMWRNHAKDFLSAANGGAGMHKLRAENEKLRTTTEVQANQIAMLQRQLDALIARVDQGIQPGMIAPPQPTIAQGMASRPARPQMHFSNDGIPDPPEGDEGNFVENQPTRLSASADPLFVEEPVNFEVAENSEQPRKPGRKPLPRDAAGNIIRPAKPEGVL